MLPEFGPRALLRALVVDPDQRARQKTKSLLHGEGFDSELTGDGIEALQYASALRVDLVVTELEMPRMSGYELVDLIGRGAFGSSPPPIIICSEDPPKRLANSPWLQDVAAFVLKPVTREELRFAIAKAFEL